MSDYNRFLGIPKKKIISFNKKKEKFEFKKETDIKEIVKGLRYFRNDMNYDLRKPLAPQSKAKILKVALEFYALRKRENVEIIVPRKKNRKLVGELTSQNKNWTKFFIQSEGKNKKIIYKKIGGKRTAVLKTPVAEYYNVYFNKIKLATNTEKEVLRVLKPIPKENKKVMKVICGKHLTRASFNQEKDMVRIVEEFMTKYDNYEEWLEGIQIVNRFTGKK